MNTLQKIVYTGIPTLLATLALTMSGCSNDWTTPESLPINQPTIQTQNPELYAEYLEALRQYKKEPHTMVYGWYDNSEATPYSRAHHMTVLPDSMDIVCLQYPALIRGWQMAEMETVREEKGTRFIYDIDFDRFKAVYKSKQESATEEAPYETTFQDFLLDSLQYALSLNQKYHMDGICVRYMGKSKIHLQPDELARYNNEEALFFGIVSDWARRNSSMHVAFLGNPQNVSDKTFFDRCQMVLASALTARSKDDFTFTLHMAGTEGVPSDKVGIVASGTYDSDTHKEKGYFANGTLAGRGLAEWAPYDYNGQRVQAVGIQNIGPDYYSPSRVYDICRTLIEKTNPHK